MSVAYNDYVLTTSLDQGWIQPEQANQVRVVIAANPQVAALDLMEEQQLLPAEHVQVLRGLIAQAGGVVRSKTAVWSEPIWRGRWRWERVICIWVQMPRH